MQKFLNSNDTIYRLGRTILQGVIGVLIANIDLLVSAWSFSPQTKAFIVALVMAVLSPIMSELGVATDSGEDDESIYEECEDEEEEDEEGDE